MKHLLTEKQILRIRAPMLRKGDGTLNIRASWVAWSHRIAAAEYRAHVKAGYCSPKEVDILRENARNLERAKLVKDGWKSPEEMRVLMSERYIAGRRDEREKLKTEHGKVLREILRMVISMNPSWDTDNEHLNRWQSIKAKHLPEEMA